MIGSFPEQDRLELQAAKRLLENPGLAAKMTNLAGMPIERFLDSLPDGVRRSVGEITRAALMKASGVALASMKDVPGEASSNLWHKLGVAVSGGVGGFFGVAALTAELPVSTTIMLRSIADIARGEGESISAIETRLACIEVFALGGNSRSDDATESGYYAVRALLAKSVTDASHFVATRTVVDEGAPVLVRLVTQVAERFGVQVTEKVAAQAIPAIGAVGGALINTLFMDHFQDMAKGHFVVRRLERDYGAEAVRRLYDSLP